MLFSLVLPLLTQLVVPLALVAWLAYRRPPCRASSVLGSVLAAAYIFAIAVAGLWLILPWYLPFVYGALLIPAVARSLRVARRGPPAPDHLAGFVAALRRAGQDALS